MNEVFGGLGLGSLDEVTFQKFSAVFDRVDGYNATFGEYYTPLDENRHKLLRVMNSLAQTKIFFQKGKEDFSIYTTKISQYILKVFEGAIGYQFYEPKFSLMSGNGVELFAFLKALGRVKDGCFKELLKWNITEVNEPSDCRFFPRFGASLTFELSQKKGTNSHFARILYNGEVLKICGEGDGYCAFNDFAKILEKNFIDDDQFKKQCVEYDVIKHRLEDVKDEVIFYRIGIVFCVIMSVMFIVCIVVDVLFKKRDRDMILETLKRYKLKEKEMERMKARNGGQGASLESSPQGLPSL